MSRLNERVARAAIAKLFLRDPNIIEAQEIEAGMVRASYKSDGLEHAYHVRVEGNRGDLARRKYTSLDNPVGGVITHSTTERHSGSTAMRTS